MDYRDQFLAAVLSSSDQIFISSSTKFGYTSRKHGFTPWKRSAPQAIEDIPISSEHVGVQVKRKNLAFAGFLATHSLMKQTNTKP